MKMRQLFLLIFLIHPLKIFAVSDIESHPNWNLLNPDRCGISTSDRIVGGIDAVMGAFPWLARLGYVPWNATSDPPIYDCGGTVINKFYIITAAHCCANLPKKIVLARVRLGEHNTETNPDCEDSFCNDPYVEYDVGEIIAHEKYDNVNVKNDIALLRVTKEIQFTDFVRPICMIKGKLLAENFDGQIAEVAGWGFLDSDGVTSSKVLQTVKLPIRPISICNSKVAYQNHLLDSRQICAGGVIGQDSCGGDSGGPLMKVAAGVVSGSPRYFIIGVVSFGAKHCGRSEIPGIYTNLSKYLLWILDHLRP